MTPITFVCHATLRLPSEQIAAQILDLAKWPEFSGFWPLPAIRSAKFETRTPEIVGTRIRVTNTDGSHHVEEIVEWDPQRRVRLRFGEFSSPLSRLATGFDEIWRFERAGDELRVNREFALHPTSLLTRPLLWVIARLLKKAVERHLRQMSEAVA